MKLVLISFVLACPLAWIAMERWLQNFAYRIEINFSWFVLTGLLVVFFAQVTVIIQTVKAALTNPVDVIRYE